MQMTMHSCPVVIIPMSGNSSGMCVETNNEFGNIEENKVLIGSGLEEVFHGDNRKKMYEVKNLMCCIVGNYLMIIT